MKISYSFYSLKDISHLSNGERLLEILLSYGLVVDKADNHEPVRKDFIKNNFPQMWKGVGIDGGCLSCDFLFKGTKEIKFSGMVTWNLNLHQNTEAFNGIDLWLNIPKSYNIDNLMKLGDDIFVWSEAVYGYITEESKDPSNNLIGNIYNGLPGLMWVNYFGKPYITEPNFHILNDYIPTSHGVRLVLSEKPNDEILSNSNFLESIKNEIGVEWFRSRPRGYNKKVPIFDNSEITMK